jgi:hypothetical protein
MNWTRRHLDQKITLEEAMALYPPEETPGLMPDTTTQERDYAGRILTNSLRKLMKEVVEFRRLFLNLKSNAQYTTEYALVRRKDIDAIETLWNQMYTKNAELNKLTGNVDKNRKD